MNMTIIMFKEKIKRALFHYGIFILSLGTTSPGATEFNINVLDVDERNEIDLSHFSDPEYVTPGEYLLSIKVNSREIRQQMVSYLPNGNHITKPTACLPPDIVDKLALKKEARKEIVLWNDGMCVDLTPIPGVKISNQIGMGSLNITIPQAWLMYNDSNWVPPEQWDHGIGGALLDYNLVGNIRHDTHNGDASRYLSSYGTAGFNLGAWRYRADYRYFLYKSNHSTRDRFSWDQFYAYRPLPTLSADLKLGEMYFNSDLFDSYRFTGISVENNENMLPPSQRGYAPEIRGVAKSNATVTVMQNGRMVYETTVPAGPFAIQDLKNGISGTMDVRVTEEDGTVTTFQTEAASLPYLTRPGHVQYKLSAGRPSDTDHHIQGPAFSAAEASWGLSNAWSVYGGAILSDNYQSWSAGIGRNLYLLGALSADITQSHATIPTTSSSLTGHSFSLNWSKYFDSIDSQISFAGYRFSEKTYMSMSQYLYTLNHDDRYHNEKERYTLTLAKNFATREKQTLLSGLSTYLSYTHQTYWNATQQDRYGISLNKYVDIGAFKGIAINFSAYRTEFNKRQDDSLYLSFSIPLGEKERLSYSTGHDNRGSNQTLTYTNNVNPGSSWNLSTRYDSRENMYLSGNYTRLAPMADANVGIAWQQDSYTYLSGALRGGVTATRHGVAAHPKGNNGGTRIMVDTDGQADVPFSGSQVKTNRNGLAVIANTSSYYDVSTRIDVQKLPENIEATTTVVQGTLTEGAIGYRKFDVVSGEKILGHVTLNNGKFPPFAALVKNRKGRDIAMITDNGQAYITGVSPNETLSVIWDGKTQCHITLPANLNHLESLLLPCKPAN
ncbi:PapC/FimD family outer membrane usher protein [Brenneria roseae subsp. roseae]|uniref:fimbria/pilus outer membrane usher protein n=1 Tax=Brenneria roseae TaxID=1509241 RepID=UPI000D61C0AB|nr:fimbria/pilus outer membrane usher protein [Brenneria roseae]PWC20486.1 PapC/FimD family outer membrane usher protein [Brenneria roseae subsp. roseae]